MNKKKILMVEDEAQLVEMVQMRLGVNNYEVLTAYNGEEALEKARKEKPDLILLDLMLPKMDGYKVCSLLKNDPRYNKIPIIMLTARAQEEEIELGRELGADAYITKPFESEDLLAKIKELLKQ
ncbi:MAG: response regulator [Candidatus Omnitrophota bacterium]|nr:response regulator [Candidatus Omnitrophota bacterium]